MVDFCSNSLTMNPNNPKNKSFHTATSSGIGITPQDLSIMNVTSKLENDVSIKGRLSFKGNLYLDCPFEGQIESEGSLIVGEHANILGEVFVENLTLYGRIEGNVHAKNTCTLKARSVLHGDLNCERLSLVEGADFTGFATVVSDRSDVDPNATKRDPWDYPTMEEEDAAYLEQNPDEYAVESPAEYTDGYTEQAQPDYAEELPYEENVNYSEEQPVDSLDPEAYPPLEEQALSQDDSQEAPLADEQDDLQSLVESIQLPPEEEPLPSIEEALPPPSVKDKFSKFKK